MADLKQEARCDNLNQESEHQYDHQCYICDKTFSANSNLNRHLRKIHKENVQSPYNNIKCAICSSNHPSSALYNQHLIQTHHIDIEIETLSFPNKESFQEWKYKVETETTSQFIKSRGEKKTKKVKTYYSCNRSGNYISKARTKKCLKKQGSRKINGRCPASMNVTINPDSTYDVKYVKTHVGHDFELQHLDISEKDREFIVEKLKSGFTKRDIIKQLTSDTEDQQNEITAFESTAPIELIVVDAPNETIHGMEMALDQTSSEIVIESSTGEVKHIVEFTPDMASSNESIEISKNHKSRLHLATTKDIHNIINSMQLDRKMIGHNYDLRNLEAWMQEMRKNGGSSAIFYKSQREVSKEYPKLKDNDFMLVIMREGQSEMLKKFGEKCIIIDSTYQVHCEYLHLTVLSVVDDEGKGFPVASMFSTRTNIDVLEVFFSVIKEKVGRIDSKIVIADELNDFYFAWSNVMSRPTHNLLTPWSVFETWSKGFETISKKDKIRKLKRSVKPLLFESNKEKFEALLKKFKDEYSRDPDLTKFMELFEDKFTRNTDFWSDNLRSSYGIKNIQLWKLHDKFLYVYKTGKSTRKMCKFVDFLSNLHDEDQLLRLKEIEQH